MAVCISCGVDSDKVVKFHCPNCGEVLIVRCSRCRRTAEPYKCPKCGFVGP